MVLKHFTREKEEDREREREREGGSIPFLSVINKENRFSQSQKIDF